MATSSIKIAVVLIESLTTGYPLLSDDGFDAQPVFQHRCPPRLSVPSFALLGLALRASPRPDFYKDLDCKGQDNGRRDSDDGYARGVELKKGLRGSRWSLRPA